MDGIKALEETTGASGFPEAQVDELAAYISQVERDFAGEAEEILDMFNLSHLKVHC